MKVAPSAQASDDQEVSSHQTTPPSIPKRLVKRLQSLPDWAMQIIAVLSMLAVWDFAASLFFTATFFPRPTTVAATGWSMLGDGSLWEHVLASLKRIGPGFALGSMLGAPVGLAIGHLRKVGVLLDTAVQFFRFVPSIAWLTPAVIWFGIGEEPKIFIIAYTTVFIVIINTAVGVGRLSATKVRAAQSLGATGSQVFTLVVIPATVPYVLTGMRIAMAYSFMTVVSAEMIAARSGLGFMIWSSRIYFAMDVVFVGIVVLGAFGLASDRLFRVLINRFAGQFSAPS